MQVRGHLLQWFYGQSLGVLFDHENADLPPFHPDGFVAGDDEDVVGHRGTGREDLLAVEPEPPWDSGRDGLYGSGVRTRFGLGQRERDLAFAGLDVGQESRLLCRISKQSQAGTAEYGVDHIDRRDGAGIAGQSLRYRRQSAEIPATLYGGKETTHSKLNNDIGLADDPGTKALTKFVIDALK